MLIEQLQLLPVPFATVTMAQHLLTVKFFLLAAGLSVAQCASVAHSQNLAVRQDDLLASGIRRPPQAPCVYNDTVASIQQKAVDYNTTKLGVVKDILASVTPETATFDNVLLPFLQNEDLTKTHMWPTSGYYLGANDDLAAAIDEMWDSANNAFNAVFTNPDFFALVDAIYKANDTSLSEENIIVTAKVWADFAGSGLNIPAGAERDRYHNISDRISDIRSEFNENLSNAKVIVYFTADELEGVPAETLASLKNGTGENAGKYEIDIALYQNYGEIVPYAINETTRYTCLVEQNNKAPENVPLLAESLELRFEEAQIFNYSTWSDYT
jgi:metallopeptidase MepB